MKHMFVFALCAALVCGASVAEPHLEFKTARADLLEIRRGDDGPILVTCQTTETHGRPYLHPLRSPDGKGVLTQFSPGHHKHQTGLYWGPTRINGRDYFHNYSPDYWANTKISPHPNLGEGPVSWTITSDLLDEKGESVLRETQQWLMADHTDYYVLDLIWSAEAQTDVVIGQYPYGGLFLRMPWKQGIAAKVLNSEGQTGQAGEGKSARWVDLAMEIESLDGMAHIAMIDHPRNPGYPTLWRIDGQFGVGPALTRKGDVTIPKGESARYRYRLVIYQGDFDRALVENTEESFRELGFSEGDK